MNHPFNRADEPNVITWTFLATFIAVFAVVYACIIVLSLVWPDARMHQEGR